VITLTTFCDWEVVDFSAKRPGAKTVSLPAGTYTMERKPNPYREGVNILVVSGTMHGMSENAWRQWEDSDDEAKVVISEVSK
jgi:hypothetical protein